MQAFLDMVSEYAQKESADLNRFLRWWDETGYRKTIATPDGQNAIRILTVHKSKGLGFKVVIILSGTGRSTISRQSRYPLVPPGEEAV